MIGVTGGGYVGSIIIEKLLKQGEKVRCIDNFHKGNCDHLFQFIKDYTNFEFQHGDINHEEDIKKFCKGLCVILNTAAIVGLPQSKRYQVLAKQTHTYGIINLLIHRPFTCPFIQFSTDSCYGMNDNFCTEDTKPNPQSLYGSTKLEAEKIVLDANNTLVLRFSTGMGVSNVMRCNLLVNDLVYSAVTEKRLELFEPDVSRSFINVRDMADAAIFFVKLLDKQKNKHRLYNIGHDGLNYTKRQLAELIREKTGCEVTYKEGKDPDCRDYKISHQRQYEAGFTPNITMDETIDELIRAVPLIAWQRKYQ